VEFQGRLLRHRNAPARDIVGREKAGGGIQEPVHEANDEPDQNRDAQRADGIDTSTW